MDYKRKLEVDDDGSFNKKIKTEDLWRKRKMTLFDMTSRQVNDTIRNRHDGWEEPSSDGKVKPDLESVSGEIPQDTIREVVNVDEENKAVVRRQMHQKQIDNGIINYLEEPMKPSMAKTVFGCKAFSINFFTHLLYAELQIHNIYYANSFLLGIFNQALYQLSRPLYNMYYMSQKRKINFLDFLGYTRALMQRKQRDEFKLMNLLWRISSLDFYVIEHE